MLITLQSRKFIVLTIELTIPLIHELLYIHLTKRTMSTLFNHKKTIPI